MDNLDLIFLDCFSSFYCQFYLGLKDVWCDAVEINPPVKFNLCQSEWQCAVPGKIKFSSYFNHALLSISTIPAPL